jgi:chromosome partitioning protein
MIFVIYHALMIGLVRLAQGGVGMIIVIGGVKGGTGKSTIATNLAVFAAKAGKQVCLIDADPQKTVTNWVGLRPSEGLGYTFMLMELTSPKFPDGRPDPRGIAPRLLAFAKDYELLIVDCGGRDSSELRSAMLVADLVISPFAPSSYDITTLPQLLELIAKAEIVRGRELPVLAVTSLAHTNPLTKGVGLLRGTFADISEYLSLSDTVVHNREANRSLANDGLCIADKKEADYKAYSEMRRLYDEIFPDADEAESAGPRATSKTSV